MGLAWTEFNLSSWAIAGTLLANAMLTDASWRIMFYIATGYGAFSLIGTACVYFPPSHPRPDGKTKWQEFKELDFVGAVLFVSGLAVFLYGLVSHTSLSNILLFTCLASCPSLYSISRDHFTQGHPLDPCSTI
jgi:MFS family permease